MNFFKALRLADKTITDTMNQRRQTLIFKILKLLFRSIVNRGLKYRDEFDINDDDNFRTNEIYFFSRNYPVYDTIAF